MNSYYNDPLAEIYNENYWRINRVSPMYNLQYTEIKLKQYATKIRQALLSDGTTGSLKTYKVLVQNLPMLKYSVEEFEGLKITITFDSKSNSNTKEIYGAIFLAWGVSISIENCVHLPYMLEHGDQKIGTNVKDTIQKIFDCNVKQYNFTQIQLLRFGFDFIENDSSKRTDPFVLSFKNPQVDLKEKFTLSFDIGDIHIIWNSIKDEGGEQYDLVTRAFNVLRNQIHHMTTLDITVYDLWQVSLPKAEIKSSGVVKIKTPELINSVFTILNEITNFSFDL